MNSPNTSLSDLIRREADHCVKCGLCLPRCPTYLKTRNEGDSPRGRIALLQGLVDGELADSPALRRHLDGCLGCRACERACPSTVAYGRLLDAGRSLLKRRPNDKPAPYQRLLQDPRRSTALLRLYQHSGLQWLARRSGLLHLLGRSREDAYLPPLPRRRLRREFYPPVGRRRGEVALFTGCAGWIFDQDTLAAAVKLFTRLGYGVHVPAGQRCCGALALHGGDPGRARTLARANMQCFNPLEVDALIFTASGCGAMLREYGELHRLAGGPVLALRPPLMEICRFLADRPWSTGALRPLSGTALIHEPCSLRHVLRGTDAAPALLQRIPDLTLRDLPDNHLCCGAAGDYLFREPAMADALLADKIARLRETDASLLVTSNIGCALHLQRGIREAGLAVEVLHPVQLLARQLD